MLKGFFSKKTQNQTVHNRLRLQTTIDFKCNYLRTGSR